MCSRHQPGGAVERWTEIISTARLGFPDVQPYAHAQRPRLCPWLVEQTLLRFQAGDYTVKGRIEDSHQPIAGSLDHLSV